MLLRAMAYLDGGSGSILLQMAITALGVATQAYWEKSKDGGEDVKLRRAVMSRQAMVGLIESLESTVTKLDWAPRGTAWGIDYEITNYSESAFEHKSNS